MSYLNSPEFRQSLSNLFQSGPAPQLLTYMAGEAIGDLVAAGLSPGPLKLDTEKSPLHQALVCQARLFSEEARMPAWHFQAYCWGVPISLKGASDDCLMLEVGIRVAGDDLPAGGQRLGETVLLHTKFSSDDVAPGQLLEKIEAAIERCWVNRKIYRLDGKSLAAELTEHIAP